MHRKDLVPSRSFPPVFLLCSCGAHLQDRLCFIQRGNSMIVTPLQSSSTNKTTNAYTAHVDVRDPFDQRLYVSAPACQESAYRLSQAGRLTRRFAALSSLAADAADNRCRTVCVEVQEKEKVIVRLSERKRHADRHIHA